MTDDEEHPEDCRTNGERIDTAAAARRIDGAVRRVVRLFGRQKTRENCTRRHATNDNRRFADAVAAELSRAREGDGYVRI